MGELVVFKDRLKQAIKDQDIKAADLAKNTGLSPSSISKWLSGKTPNIKKDSLEKLATCLNVNMDWLAGSSNVIALETNEQPSDEFVQIPEYDVIIGAGEAYEPTFEEAENSVPATYRADFFKRLGIKPSDCRRLRVKGDSMEPLIMDGDHITVDCTPCQQIIDNRIYVFAYKHTVRVKRLIKPLKGGLILKSENQEYEDVFLPEDEATQVYIIGRVIDRSGCIR